jgi:hypothetical protein
MTKPGSEGGIGNFEMGAKGREVAKVTRDE